LQYFAFLLSKGIIREILYFIFVSWSTIFANKRFISWIKAKRAKTQKEYIAAKMPKEFLFVNRLPFMIAVLFVCLSLSTGFPILILVCCLSFFVMFIVEKKIFISFSKKPPIYTEKIYKIVEKCVLFGLMLHCLFAIYIYGEESIFPNNVSILKVNDLVTINTQENENSFIDDLMRRAINSPFFIILFLLVLLTFVLDIIINILLSSNLKSKFLKNFENNIEGTYFTNFNIIHYNDLPKYDFRLTEE
jgi:hypothetical protein